MLSFLTQVLLIAFVATSAAQPCNFCPGGLSPEFGDLVLFLDIAGSPVTCDDVVAAYLDPTTGACGNLYKEYEYVCRCPGVEPGPCIGICQIGSTITLPDALSGFDGTDCFVLNKFVQAITNQDFCEDFSDPETRADCGCTCVSANKWTVTRSERV